MLFHAISICFTGFDPNPNRWIPSATNVEPWVPNPCHGINDGADGLCKDLATGAALRGVAAQETTRLNRHTARSECI